MAEPVPSASDLSAGTYKCINCGPTIHVGPVYSLPPWPSCNHTHWQALSGGDVVGAGHTARSARQPGRGGWEVTVVEQGARPGGAVHSWEDRLPGLVEDPCSGYFPLARASPAFEADLPAGRATLEPDHGPPRLRAGAGQARNRPGRSVQGVGRDPTLRLSARQDSNVRPSVPVGGRSTCPALRSPSGSHRRAPPLGSRWHRRRGRSG